MSKIPYEAWVMLKDAGLAGKRIYIPKWHPEYREKKKDEEEKYLAEIMRKLATGEKINAALVKGETGLSWARVRALLREARRRIRLIREKGLDPAEVFGLSE